MKSSKSLILVIVAILALGQTASADLYHYFPIDEGAGGSTANQGTEGTAGTVVNFATGGLGGGGNAWILGDATRGTVLSGNDNNASSAHVTTAGVPHTIYNGSWTQTMWASVTGTGNDVVLGNRFGGPGGFAKLDTNNFEWQPSGAGAGGNTGPGTGTPGVWHQYTIVKDGTAGTIQSFQDGVPNGGPDARTKVFNAGTVPYNLFGDGGERPGGRYDEVGFFLEAFSTGKAAGLYNFSDTSQAAAYGLDDVDGIFDVFDNGGSYESDDGLTWTQASGLGGGLGDLVPSGGGFEMALDGSGNGVVGASAIPEPATICSLLIGALFFLGYGRRQRRT